MGIAEVLRTSWSRMRGSTRKSCMATDVPVRHAGGGVQHLAQPIQEEVRRFFDLNEAWLGQVLADGRQEGSLRFGGTPEEMARVLLGALEGAMLVARSYGDPARFEDAARRLIADLRSEAPAK
jgi:hypothetical protein